MLRPHAHPQAAQQPLAPAVLITKPFINGLDGRVIVLPRRQRSVAAKSTRKSVRLGFVPGSIRAVASPTAAAEMSTTTVKAVVTVTPPTGGAFYEIGISRGLDDITDLMGKTLLLELVSSELDPSK